MYHLYAIETPNNLLIGYAERRCPIQCEGSIYVLHTGTQEECQYRYQRIRDMTDIYAVWEDLETIRKKIWGHLYPGAPVKVTRVSDTAPECFRKRVGQTGTVIGEVTEARTLTVQFAFGQQDNFYHYELEEI